jgi:hypothetical protein
MKGEQNTGQREKLYWGCRSGLGLKVKWEDHEGQELYTTKIKPGEHGSGGIGSEQQEEKRVGKQGDMESASTS